MPSELSDQEKIRRLPWFYGHSATNSVFTSLTFFGPVFVLFLGQLGLPKARIGFLLSLLPFTGLVALFIAPAVARLGVKRVFIACWGARKAVAGLLLLAPWVLERHGADAAFALVTAIVAAFALLRAAAETAWFPWAQEIVPAFVRGRFNGINNFVSMLTGSIALGAASWVLDNVAGLGRFMWLIAVGVGFGVAGTLCALPMPGGGPGGRRPVPHLRAMAQALGDAGFRRYLVAAALTMLTVQSVLMAFLPLFMKEQVGLAEGQILLLQVATYTTGLLSGFAWGWQADRRGGKSSLMAAIGLLTLLPLCWLVLPRHHELSFAAGLAVAALAGIAATGWSVCDQRLLYVGIVPHEQRTEYMALYYACLGLVGGTGPLLAGLALDRLHGLEGHWGILHIDPYAPLFAGTAVMLALALVALAGLQVREESPALPGQGLLQLPRWRRARVAGRAWGAAAGERGDAAADPEQGEHR